MANSIGMISPRWDSLTVYITRGWVGRRHLPFRQESFTGFSFNRDVIQDESDETSAKLRFEYIHNYCRLYYAYTL